MKKYIVVVNNGIYYDYMMKKNVFNREELELSFKNWSEGEDMIDEDDNVVSIDDLMNERREIYNESMVERGDEFVEIEICEVME